MSGSIRRLSTTPLTSRAGYVIDGIDLFDAALFGYSPREAETIDPQQRLFLECAWATLEDAGYVPKDCNASVGVFGGARASGYLRNLEAAADHLGTSTGFSGPDRQRQGLHHHPGFVQIEP